MRAKPRTTIALEAASRDALAAYARELGGITMDEAVRSLLWEHDCTAALARLDADPAEAREYRERAQAWAEFEVTVADK